MTLETRDDATCVAKTYGAKGRRNWRASRDDEHSRFCFRKIEKMFYYYSRIKEAVYWEMKARESYYSQRTGKTGGGSSNHAFISDPTAMLAMKLCGPIKKIIINAERLDEEVIDDPQKWMIMVEQTLAHFEEEDLIGEILRRRYFENETSQRSCACLGITNDKYYRLLKVGITYARECAIQLGLIKVFEAE